jgi:predicted nucleic acid-binding protein
MGKGYLIDTNVVIDYLENKLPEHSLTLIDDLNIQISIISRMELLAWPKASESQLAILTGFINASNVLSLSEDIILKTIDIRKDYRVKLPDAIIAATAIINDFSLFTRNITDFKKINGLTIIDPYSIKQS